KKAAYKTKSRQQIARPIPRVNRQQIGHGGDQNYGTNVQAHDISPDLLKKECAEYVARELKVTRNDMLSATTISQSSSPKWFAERAKRISASKFSEVARRRRLTP